MNPFENLAAPAESKESEVVKIIDELVAEVGVRCVMAAFCKSQAGDAPSAVGQAATLRAIHFILRSIIKSPNAILEAEIMAMGAGLLTGDETMTEVAKRHGISRAAISKRAVAFCEKVEIRPSSFMRSESDRLTYSLTNQPRLA